MAIWVEAIAKPLAARLTVVVITNQCVALVRCHDAVRQGASAGKHKASRDWRETIYAPEENRERHEIQQRVWRRALEEETPDDLRADAIDEHYPRMDEE